MTIKCSKCGVVPSPDKPFYLERVNPKGVAGIFECRPTCGADLPQETLLQMAIEGDAALDAMDPKQVKS